MKKLLAASALLSSLVIADDFVPRATKAEALQMTGLGFGEAPDPMPPVFRPKETKAAALQMTGLGLGTAPVDPVFKPKVTTAEPLQMTGLGR